MDERLSDLLTARCEHCSADVTINEVEAFLASQGYDRRQSGEIFALPVAEFTSRAAGTRRLIHASMTFRVLGPHERGRFAPEAWGHLLSLNGSGVLNATELEHVIERALTHIDGRIALDDLRSLMEGSGFDDAGTASEHVTVH